MAIRLSSLLFVVQSSDTRNAYSTCSLLVVDPATRYSSARLEFAWQCDSKDARDGKASWYGGEFTVRATDSATLKLGARILAEVEAIGNADGAYFSWRNSPAGVAGALESLELHRAHYDACASEYRRVDAVCLAPFARYVDNWEAYGQDSCSVDAVARDAEEAQSLVLKAFVEYAINARSMGNTRAQREARMVAWIAAGKPVRLVDRGPESIPALCDVLHQSTKASVA